MVQVVIEDPILNAAFAEPARHFKFGDDGITDEIVDARRPSSYFVPIPATKKRGGNQQAFDTEWTADRVEENAFINRVRERIDRWRSGGYQHVTPTTRRLLDYWTAPDRERKLFFCQIEALETAIYLTEAATKVGDTWIANELRRFADDANPGLFRLAHKMATGTGKTVVMAMLIAWNVLNKAANPQDARYGDSFLVVTPGITIRDRLRVVLPSDPGNYYRERDLAPADLADHLGRSRIVIANFHAFQRRESKAGKAAKLTKAALNPGGESPFLETPDQMVRRVCRELGPKKNVVVLNDEAHHCYRHRSDPDEAATGEPQLTGDERKEAVEREEAARVWISGLEAASGDSSVPVEVDLGGAATAIAAGSFHRCAVISSGGVKCWGSDAYGQLGDGRSAATSGPVDVQGLSGPVVAVTAGSYYSCALLISGAVQCWGRNTNGTLGDGTTTDSYVATQTLGLNTGVTAIATYEEHTCAIVAGAAKCWGLNTYGELGDNSTSSRTTPTSVVGLGAEVVAVAPGAGHTCALINGGFVKCWGRNTHGELGNNSTTGSLAPVQVSGLRSGVKAIASGPAQSCAVNTKRTGKCWGYNGEGELGNNSTNSSLVPATIVGA